MTDPPTISTSTLSVTTENQSTNGTSTPLHPSEPDTRIRGLSQRTVRYREYFGGDGETTDSSSERKLRRHGGNRETDTLVYIGKRFVTKNSKNIFPGELLYFFQVCGKGVSYKEGYFQMFVDVPQIGTPGTRDPIPEIIETVGVRLESEER